MRKLLVLIVGLMLLMTPGVALAQPVATPAATACAANAIRLDDLAGIYINQDSPMRLDIAPCGGLMLTWDNTWGRHRAAYGAVQRFPDGMVVAGGLEAEPFGVFLDDGHGVAVGPADPGWVKVITLSPYLTSTMTYRLQKVT